jgi:hypothetical protein
MSSHAETEKKRRTVRRIKEKKEIYQKLSASLFEPDGRNPYYLIRGNDKSIMIRNLKELRDNLDAFSGAEEAHWLASWLEYLGDHEGAARIRAQPEKFKEIVRERYNELSEFYP